MLPKSIYESLPYAYVTCGVLTLVLLQTIARVIPGFMLISAGILILQMRFTYRQEQEYLDEQREARRARLAARKPE